ncbi:tubulin-specific chaperone D-like [Watersipora subatra]|uniref:tubulin-specific chaperone D-like n=1 Tax=Watersipora subatra TaxID=2589382 RepID=UPI00355C884B
MPVENKSVVKGATPVVPAGLKNIAQNLHERFMARDEVVDILHSLKTIHSDKIKTEKAIERFTYLVDEYQEQPHLVDPHLEEIVHTIISTARQKDCVEGHMYLLFTCLHLLTKMRGYKVIVRYLPHEVADVEPVLELLQKQDPDNVYTWQNRYCLLLWLSMVAMIPFDLVRLDNTLGDGDSKLPVMDRILNIGKLYLCVTDKSSDAGAYMMARFLTRPDVKKRCLPDVIDWAITALKSGAGEETFTLFTSSAVIGGILKMLALLYKTGSRDDLIPFAGRILQLVMQEPVIHMSTNIIIRKLGVKLIQRIGLVYLKAKVASWRYNRGSRSLAANLAGIASSAAPAAETVEEDEDYDVPEEIEEVIEHLLTSLKDKDTIVRWSAAKGIGRITGRLPRELADDIIQSLLELFTMQETDVAWHGGCLALAELGRRGLLLPQRLPEVIPVISRSLTYDEKKGFNSVGAHVRDAACYVCWSFARAYEPADIREYALQIASSLLTVAVFDREVNVRRAASAAFQENVGRQGTFPHGIDIVTTCDYFAVGIRSNAFLELSAFVGGFPEYTRPLVDHLIDHKIKHWARDIRVLASRALHNLTPLNTEYLKSSVLPKLVSMATGFDLNARHGAIHSLGKVCLSLTNAGVQVDQEILDKIAEIEPVLRSGELLLGLGGEYMRQALCSMIADLSKANLFKQPKVLDHWQALLNECLYHRHVGVQEAAIASFSNFFQLKVIDGVVSDTIKDEVINDYLLSVATADTERTRIACCLALGALPKEFLRGKLKQVLPALIKCTKCSAADGEWAEARRDALKSMERICVAVGVQEDGDPNECVCRGNIEEIYESYLLALQDYTIDNRGDAGAWVREAAIFAIQTLTVQLVGKAPQLLNKDTVERVFQSIVQQACEKIDRTREVAGTAFAALLYNQPELPYVPCRQSLEEIFPQDEVKLMNFAAPGSTFPRFARLLDLDDYRFNVLLGFTVSVGGLTESLVKHSNSALLNHVQSGDTDQRLSNMSSAIVDIFKKHSKVDRVTIPLMKMTSQLLASGVYEDVASNPDLQFPLELLAQIKEEIAKCGDPQKLMTASELLCGLLMFYGAIRNKCLFQLSILLCHRFPIVRKVTANSLYESLITNDDIVEDNSEEIMSLLSDNHWDKPVADLRPIRNQLCQLFGISAPAMKKTDR